MSGERKVHPTALVDPTADLGEGVEVGAYAVIHRHCILGAGTRVGSFAVVGPNVRAGRDNVIWHHAAIGADPQDLTYKGEDVWLHLGDGNTIREFVTMNRGTWKAEGVTRIGSRNLFMACSHVAHDCVVGDGVIMANAVLLAGHVTVDDRAILNGAAAVQQYSTIGRLSYVGGLTRIVHDVPPFMVVEGNPSKVRKVNTVGLERNGFTGERIDALREAFRRIFRNRAPRSENLDAIEAEPGLTPEVAELCKFLRRVERGQHGRGNES